MHFKSKQWCKVHNKSKNNNILRIGSTKSGIKKETINLSKKSDKSSSRTKILFKNFKTKIFSTKGSINGNSSRDLVSSKCLLNKLNDKIQKGPVSPLGMFKLFMSSSNLNKKSNKQANKVILLKKFTKSKNLLKKKNEEKLRQVLSACDNKEKHKDNIINKAILVNKSNCKILTPSVNMTEDNKHKMTSLCLSYEASENENISNIDKSLSQCIIKSK